MKKKIINCEDCGYLDYHWSGTKICLYKKKIKRKISARADNEWASPSWYGVTLPR